MIKGPGEEGPMVPIKPLTELLYRQKPEEDARPGEASACRTAGAQQEELATMVLGPA